MPDNDECDMRTPSIAVSNEKDKPLLLIGTRGHSRCHPNCTAGTPCLSSPTESVSAVHASCPDWQGNAKRRVFRLAHAITCMPRTILLCPPSIPGAWNRWKPFQRQACGCLSPSCPGMLSAKASFSAGHLRLLFPVIAFLVFCFPNFTPGSPCYQI